MTIHMDLQTAPSLEELVRRVAAGDEIVLASEGKPVVRLSRAVLPDRKAVFGMLKGQITISDDFNDPLPEEDLKAWGL